LGGTTKFRSIKQLFGQTVNPKLFYTFIDCKYSNLDLKKQKMVVIPTDPDLSGERRNLIPSYMAANANKM
jgi:hypothetical protein